MFIGVDLGSTNIKAAVYDAQMRTIAYNEDGTPTGNDFQLVYPLEAGKTYYYAAGFYGWDDIGAFPVRLEKQDSLLAVAAGKPTERWDCLDILHAGRLPMRLFGCDSYCATHSRRADESSL